MLRRSAAVRGPSNAVRAGFTLIDLVITVMIIGIMAAVGTPKYFSQLDRYRVDAAAKQMVNNLKTVRRKAMAVSAETNVNFIIAANKYVITGLDNLDHAGQPNEVFLADTGYPVMLVSADFDTYDTIKFDHYGRPYVGSDVNKTAMANGTIVIQSGSETRTIVIDPTTGEASIQ